MGVRYMHSEPQMSLSRLGDSDYHYSAKCWATGRIYSAADATVPWLDEMAVFSIIVVEI